MRWLRASAALCLALLLAFISLISLTATPARAQGLIEYVGGQGFDPRDMRGLIMSMAFSGNEVAGSFRLTSACQGAVSENGGEGTFTAILTGVWESPSATIIGKWQGTTAPCAGQAPTQNFGDISILVQPGPQGQPSVVVTFTGQVAPTPSVHFFALKNQQVADGGGSPVPPVQVDYHGGVAFDPRDSRGMDMSLFFRGAQVRGMIRVPADCTNTGILVGGDLSIEAVLSGPWEGRASVIEGTWGGTTLPCGAMQSIGDRGTLRIVIDKRPDGSPGVVVNLVDDDTGPPGTFFTFAPYGKEFVAGQGVGPGVAMNYPTAGPGIRAIRAARRCRSRSPATRSPGPSRAPAPAILPWPLLPKRRYQRRGGARGPRRSRAPLSTVRAARNGMRHPPAPAPSSSAARSASSWALARTAS
jgi:hypothetical protein